MSSGAKFTSTLNIYVPEAAIDLQWITEGNIEIALPRADVKLIEHGYATSVTRTGHGLQRAFILTMLQQLAAIQAEKRVKEAENGADKPDQADASEKPPPIMPSLILVIEEPELYQHPSRQRHMSNILLKLASGSIPGVMEKTQVLYSTHSPLFVGIDRFNQVRVLRKVQSSTGNPLITQAVEVKGQSVAEKLWNACDGKDKNGNKVPQFTWSTLQPQLQAIMTPWMAEGFFADVVVFG